MISLSRFAGEGEGKVGTHHPHLCPLPPKEGEEVIGETPRSVAAKDFRIRVVVYPYQKRSESSESLLSMQPF